MHTMRNTQTHSGIVWVQRLSLPCWLGKLLNFSEKKVTFIHTIAYIIPNTALVLTPPGVRENHLPFLGTEKKHFHIFYISICSSSLLKFYSTYQFYTYLYIFKQTILFYTD